jgi:hypothetical protein
MRYLVIGTIVGFLISAFGIDVAERLAEVVFGYCGFMDQWWNVPCP